MNFSEIIEGIESFVKVATDFVSAIERNMDGFYRIKDKIRARRQIESIRHILSLFPEIWFFNGVFACDFLGSSVEPYNCDGVDKRDNKALDELNDVLDNAELAFSKNAPKVMSLGSEITLLFKQQIAFRRQLIEKAKAGQVFDGKDVVFIMRKLEALKPVEEKFWTLSSKYRDDSIRAVAAEHPEYSPEEIAKKLDLWPPRVVEIALDEGSN